MSRPLNISKRLRELWDDLLRDALGRDLPRKGKPSIEPTRLGKLSQLSRLRAERPTRNLKDFIYIQEVLANMPMANAAVRQLSEDVALDESGDPRAWSLNVGIDPIDDSADTKQKVSEFKDECQGVFTDYALRTGIGDKAKNFVFKFLTAGDCFAEQSVFLDSKTGFGRIEKITELPTWQIHVRWNDRGVLTGYEQRLYASGNFDTTYRSKSEADVVWDIPAQIIHWKYHDCDYMMYGENIFAHLQKDWEQLKLVELDTMGAIHTHAVDPEVHLLGNIEGMRLTDEEILNYESKLRDNPADINRYYVGRQGEVEYIFPKTSNADAVSKLVEARRDMENRFVAAIVPGQASTNPFDATRRAVATSFDQKYARKVTSIRQDFARYLRASLFLEFALHGIDWAGKPEQYGAKKITFQITWPDLSESRIQRSKRVLGEYVVGMTSHESSLRNLGENDPEGELDLLKKEHEEGDYPLQFMKTPSTEISPNGEQGAGVSTSPEDKNSIQTAILRSIFSDTEEIRELIRYELNALLEKE